MAPVVVPPKGPTSGGFGGGTGGSSSVRKKKKKKKKVSFSSIRSCLLSFVVCVSLLLLSATRTALNNAASSSSSSSTNGGGGGRGTTTTTTDGRSAKSEPIAGGGGNDGGAAAAAGVVVGTGRLEEETRVVASESSAESAAERRKQPKAIVGYAISITGCTNHGRGSAQPLSEGAAVLAHSVRRSSIRNPLSGSSYDYRMYAFVHPDGVECTADLGKIGYEVRIRETPVNATEIRGQFLREHVAKSGCCGEKEFLKLYAYRLLDHPIAIHMDIDTVVLKPLDDLFDAMLEPTNSDARKRIPVMHGAEPPQRIDAFFTRDYNMIKPGHPHPGVQGGFIVVRPSEEAFREYVEIVLEGNFVRGNGWGGLRYGGYFGAQQIQGLCSYYYDHLHPNTAVELDRCRYNAMVDNPRVPDDADAGPNAGKCRDGKDECQDCRETPVSEIVTAHFTLCQKPWLCWDNEDLPKLCRELHHEWFRIRKELDESRDGHGVARTNVGRHKPKHFLGYCRHPGKHGYIRTSVLKF